MNAELRQVDRDCCRKAYLTPGNRENPSRIYDYPVRVTDIDLFDHMNNAVYWGVVEDHLSATPELLNAPLRVTIEHEAPIALVSSPHALPDSDQVAARGAAQGSRI